MGDFYIKGKQVCGTTTNASAITCLDKDGNQSTVQKEMENAQIEMDKIDSALNNIGHVYKGEWIATAGGSTGQSTEILYLPIGKYLINYMIPFCDVTSACIGLNCNGTIIPYSYIVGSSYASKIIFCEITTDNTPVYVVEAGGTTRTYSYLDRGGIVAVRLNK